jgi:hypothetical protein
MYLRAMASIKCFSDTFLSPPRSLQPIQVPDKGCDSTRRSIQHTFFFGSTCLSWFPARGVALAQKGKSKMILLAIAGKVA